MIRHTVCFKLTNPTKESVEETCAILRSMEGRVPTAKKISVGADFLHSPRSYDIILQVDLDSREDLDTYQNDPYHVDVVKAHIGHVAASVIALDCDL